MQKHKQEIAVFLTGLKTVWKQYNNDETAESQKSTTTQQ